MEEPRSKRARLDEHLIATTDDCKRSEAEEEELVFEGEQYQRQLKSEDYVLGGGHYIINTSVPGKHNYRLRWQERLGSSCVPNASFTYEISYASDISELHFQTQFQYLPYSMRSYNRYLLYTVVKSSSPPLSNVVQEGDILLKCNSQDMVVKPGDSVTPSHLLSLLSARPASSTFRFLRIASSTSSLISVAEILLYLEEKGVVSARMVLKPPRVPSAGQGVGQSKLILETSFIDSQLPNAIKRSLGGQKVAWQSTPPLPVPPAQATAVLSAPYHSQPPNQATSGAATIQAHLSSLSTAPYLHPPYAVHEAERGEKGEGKRGQRSAVLRDRNKFAVLYNATVENSEEKREKVLYNLGRVDGEEEGGKVLAEARESCRASGGVFVSRHYLLGYRPPLPTPPAPPLPVPVSTLHPPSLPPAGGGGGTLPPLNHNNN